MLTIDMVSELCSPTRPSEMLRAEITKQEGDRIIDGELICDATGERFSVESGVPNIIPKSELTAEEWTMWQDHLDGFHERRQQRIKNPQRRINRWGRKSRPKGTFAEFTGIHDGKVLDVGCGAGKFRNHLPQGDIEYYGIDPIVTTEVEGFPYVRGLSEYIPFKDDTFSHVVVIAALDHFKDIDAFFKTAIRILRPDGKLHILQSVHQVRGPVSAAKMFAHWVKDSLEQGATKIRNSQAPKHINEFTTSRLFETLSNYFEVAAQDTYSYSWYSPMKLFVSLSPLPKDGLPALNISSTGPGSTRATG